MKQLNHKNIRKYAFHSNVSQYELEGHLGEHIPPPRNAWSTTTYRVQYIFEISCYIWFLALSLKSEESLSKLNNSCIQIRIRIFTKIESVRPYHTPNLPTKFPLDLCTTFWDVHHTFRQTERGENITSFTFGGGGNKTSYKLLLWHEFLTYQLFDFSLTQTKPKFKFAKTTVLDPSLPPLSQNAGAALAASLRPYHTLTI